MTESASTDSERRNDVPDWKETIVKLARSDPNLRFTTLAHRLTPEHLREAFRRLKQKAAPGPDGVTVAEYGETLDARLAELHEQLRSGRYRTSPVRRVFIPKPNGKLRPLGIANVEDRLVQKAIAMVLEPIYEQDFLDFSYGFRPRRSTKDALETLRLTIDRKRVNFVFEADIRGFFDHLDHGWLRDFLGHRIADRGIHRLIGKILNSGVVEDEVVTRSKMGAPQGGPLSPLLANIYLHYVLDLWFDRRFGRTCRGEASMVRYADDFVVCFEHRDEAERFATAVAERFAAFGLELVPEKTRLIEFGTSQKRQGPGPKLEASTFNFLGFTHYMRQKGRRGLRTARKPSMKSRTRFLAEVKQWLRRHMHRPPWLHQSVLTKKLKGWYTYFGLRHCLSALRKVWWHVLRLWYRTLLRRSQKAKRRLTWWKVKHKPWFSLPKPSLRRRKAKSKKRAERQDAQLLLFAPVAAPT